MIVVDPCDLVCQPEGWLKLASCVPFLGSKFEPGGPRDDARSYRKALELAQILEKVSLYRLQATEGLLTTTVATTPENLQATREERAQIQQSCTILSIRLAAYGLSTFIDTLTDVAPQLMGSHLSMACAMGTAISLFQSEYHDSAFGVSLIRKLLQAGVNPNSSSEQLRLVTNSPWREFLGDLTRYGYVEFPHVKRLVPHSKSYKPEGLSVVVTRKEVWAKPYVQDAIRTFIEFGAELRTEEVEILTKNLPKSCRDNFDWAEFLRTYTEPAKRIELENDRMERLKRWPDIWLTLRLTEEDRKKIHKTRELLE